MARPTDQPCFRPLLATLWCSRVMPQAHVQQATLSAVGLTTWPLTGVCGDYAGRGARDKRPTSPMLLVLIMMHVIDWCMSFHRTYCAKSNQGSLFPMMHNSTCVPVLLTTSTSNGACVDDVGSILAAVVTNPPPLNLVLNCIFTFAGLASRCTLSGKVQDSRYSAATVLMNSTACTDDSRTK